MLLPLPHSPPPLLIPLLINHARTRSVVGEANGDAIARQLVGIGGSHHHITDDLGVHDLRDNVRVREAHNHSVLGCVVLALVLDAHLAASLVVRLAFTATTALHLKALVVGAVLDNAIERLW